MNQARDVERILKEKEEENLRLYEELDKLRKEVDEEKKTI